MSYQYQKHSLRYQSILVIIAMLICTWDGAYAASSWSPTLLVNTEAFQVIDDTDASANLYIQFGGTLDKKLTYDRTGTQFRFDDDLEVYGTASGQWLHSQDRLSSSGSLAVDGASVYLNAFADCTALETDGGLLVCGTDDGGTVSAGQGLTVAGSVVRLNAAHSGTTIEGTTLLSGAIVHAQNEFRSSGSLAVDGAGFLNNEVTFGSGLIIRGVTYRFPASDGSATGKVLKTDGAGNLSWSADSGGSASPGQGITVNGSVVSLTAAHSGTTIEGTTLLSGAIVHAQNAFRSSGSLLVDGASVYFNSFASCTALETVNGLLTCGTDDGGSLTAGQGLTIAASVARLNASFSGTALEVIGTASGRILHAQDRLSSSGTIVLRPSANAKPTFFANGSQKVGIMDGNPHSTLTASGSFATAITKLTATGTINGAHQIIFASGSSMITLTLPTAVGINGRQYTIKKTNSSTATDARPVVIATTSSQKIDRLSQWKLFNRGQQVTVISDGANWQVVNSTAMGINGYTTLGNTLNQWYGSPATATALTTASRTNTQTQIGLPFIAEKVMTINAFSVGVQTATAGAAVRLGLYADNGRGYPDKLVVDAGTVDTATAGHRTLCPTGCTTASLAGALPVTIQPGHYWLSLINGNAGTETFRGYAVAQLRPTSGYPNAWTTLRNVGWTIAQTYGALPAQFPPAAAAITAVPLIVITVRVEE